MYTLQQQWVEVQDTNQLLKLLKLVEQITVQEKMLMQQSIVQEQVLDLVQTQIQAML